jgi:hypothetical protein
LTAPTGRVYPVKVTQRDLALHRRSVDALTTTTAPESLRAVVTDLRHRIACAERWEEMRAKRFGPPEMLTVKSVLFGATCEAMIHGNAERARAAARVLVRVTRPPA